MPSTLIMAFFTEGPQVDRPISVQMVSAGDTVLITCALTRGDPPISFRWTKDGRPASGSTVLRPSRMSSLLTISGAQLAHSGNYSCLATNPVASSVHSVHLTVNGNILGGLPISRRHNQYWSGHWMPSSLVDRAAAANPFFFFSRTQDRRIVAAGQTRPVWRQRGTPVRSGPGRSPGRL